MRTALRRGALGISQALLSAALFCDAAAAVQSTTAGAEPPAVAPAAQSVIDVIIHDRHGKPVRGVSSRDITIQEEGRQISAESLQSIEEDNNHPRFVTLVLDGTSETVRSLAHASAVELAKRTRHESTYFSVWAIRDRFELLQDFTTDRSSIEHAIDTAERSKGITPAIPSMKARMPLEDATIASAHTWQTSRQMLQERGARPLFAALLALAREQKTIAGRKTIFLFSNGMQLAAIKPELIRAVVADADRGQISFYSIDTSGVSAKEADRASHMVMDSMGLATSPGSVSNRANELGMSSSRRGFESRTGFNQGSAFQNLAAETGGRYVDGSEDLHKQIRAAAGDLQQYYLVTYAPPIKAGAAGFRRIVLSSNRPDLRVQSRSGLYRAPLLDGREIAPFELPLLQALGEPARAETIWFEGGLRRSAPSEDSVKSPVFTVKVPLAGLMAHESDAARRFELRLAILVLIRNSSGSIVDVLSRDVSLDGALEKLETARKEAYTFEKPVRLAPGVYRADIAISDGNAKKISVKSIDFAADPARAALPAAIGVTRDDPATPSYLRENQDPADPLAGKEFLPSPKLISDAPKPSEAELESILSGARQRVLDYKQNLPNFICLMTTRRSTDATGRGSWKASDSYTDLIGFTGGKEKTVLLEFNGKQVKADEEPAVEGARVKGEFGDLLSMPFTSKSKASWRWLGKADLAGRSMHVFRFDVMQAHSDYLVVVNHAGQAINAAYHALVYIDAKTLSVRRISIEADDLPKKFLIRESVVAVDYDYVPIGGQDYLLPLHATLFVRHGAHSSSRNEIEFNKYRKYGAESNLRTN